MTGTNIPLLRVGLALVVALTAAPTHAKSPVGAGVETFNVPLDVEGRCTSSDLWNVVLAHSGYRFRLVAEPGDSKLPVGGAEGRKFVALANQLLGSAGVRFAVQDRILRVSVDRARLGASVDALESTLRVLLGGAPPVYRLERVAASPTRGPPVVLVHGLDSSPDAVAAAGEALGRAGYDTYLYRYPNDGRIAETARRLGESLRALHDRRAAKISLVTVSMGGLIARTYLELDPSYGGEVDRFIACCPPFRGAGLARYRLLSELAETASDLFAQGWSGFFPFDGLEQAGDDLVPGSPLLARLHAASRRAGVRYSVLAGDQPIVERRVIDAAKAAAAAWSTKPSASAKPWVELLSEVLDAVEAVSGGAGDGAVSLASTRLDGVSDHLVLPLDHLEFLAPLKSGRVGALREVRARLPAP